jgi:hypothetical protein
MDRAVNVRATRDVPWALFYSHQGPRQAGDRRRAGKLRQHPAWSMCLEHLPRPWRRLLKSISISRNRRSMRRFFNHGWTRINTDEDGLCLIRVYPCSSVVGSYLVAAPPRCAASQAFNLPAAAANNVLASTHRRGRISLSCNGCRGESQRDSVAKPRVARHEPPGCVFHQPNNPNGVVAEQHSRRNPVGVVINGPRSPPQGRRCAPTLGFDPQPRWGCKKLRCALIARRSYN